MSQLPLNDAAENIFFAKRSDDDQEKKIKDIFNDICLGIPLPDKGIGNRLRAKEEIKQRGYRHHHQVNADTDTD